MPQYVPKQKLIVIYDDGEADLTDSESWQIVKADNSRALGAGIELHKDKKNKMILIWICFKDDLTIHSISNELADQKATDKIFSCWVYNDSWDQFIERVTAIENNPNRSLNQSVAILPFEKQQNVVVPNLRMS